MYGSIIDRYYYCSDKHGLVRPASTSCMNLLLYSMVKRAWCIPSEGARRSAVLLGIMYGLSWGSSPELVSDSNMEMSEFRTSRESVPCRGPNSFTWLELHRRGCLSYRTGQIKTLGHHADAATEYLRQL